MQPIPAVEALSPQTFARMQEAERRLRESGVVDIKFFKNYPVYSNLTPDEQINQLCDVIEAALDGKWTPAEPLGDSVR